MPKMIWVGLDVHKNSTTVAILEDDARDGEVVRLSADLNVLRKLFRRLGARATVKAQHRLSKRYWHLALKKHHNVAVVAVARELCGFIWAIMRAATIEPKIADALSKNRVPVRIGR